jgi:hypothetical protein
MITPSTDYPCRISSGIRIHIRKEYDLCGPGAQAELCDEKKEWRDSRDAVPLSVSQQNENRIMHVLKRRMRQMQKLAP